MIYLDHAATTFPKPDRVCAAMAGCVKNLGANPGRAGHDLSQKAGQLVQAARELAADFFALPDSRGVIFCQNCTDALNLAIKGSVQPGMHVVSTMIEHNSVLRVLKTLERRGVISLSLVPPEKNGTIRPEQISGAVKPKTGLVVMTHASNVLGRLNDIGAVGHFCRRRGVRFLVDAAQSAGKAEIDMQRMGIDLLACPGHKGLYGPQGTGLLLISPNVDLTPLREGGTGTESARLSQPDEWPERFESGTLNTPGIAGLYAALRYVRQNRAQIFMHEINLCELLLDEIRNIPKIRIYPDFLTAPCVGLISLNLAALPSGQIADDLNERGICVRGGLHCAPLTHAFLGTTQQGAVRVSFGASNTESDVHALCEALAEIAKKY